MKTQVLRCFFSTVWVVNGLIWKVLDVVPRHRQIVARILGEDHALVFTRLIGIAEIGMALWILSGIRPKWSAGAQIAAVIAMNVVEFFLVPDMLLFGHFNALVALAYVALVAHTEFLAKPN